jgi:ubiquinone/menaquinone biosynthesis C-methylase UbiE
MKHDIDSFNKKVNELEDVVNSMLTQETLQKPEETILNLFKSKLNGMKMLDIGVGTGRTTLHFEKLVKEYIGIDYSERMIEACRKKFSGKGIAFEVCDARNMDMFKNENFDFILFSYNGLDCISHEDRIKALAEIRRVSAPGAYFVFSTHNIQSIRELFKFNMSANIKLLILSLIRFCKLRIKNKNYKELSLRDYAIFTDGAQNFRVLLYYIKPASQVRQLNLLGFKNVRVFSLADGNEIKNSLEDIKDPWLYYLCEKG